MRKQGGREAGIVAMCVGMDVGVSVHVAVSCVFGKAGLFSHLVTCFEELPVSFRFGYSCE